MVRKSVLVYTVMLVFGTLMLLAATSNGISSTFKVYAANNCDATTICQNIPGTSTQNNNCTRSFSCTNFGSASSNQNNNCTRVSQCANSGASSTQNNACANVQTCSNFGNSNTQNIACANSVSGAATPGCFNGGTSTRQNTVCQSTSLCLNSGINTNVYSNSATSCTSNGPDTTTVCQNGRAPVVVPNH